MPSSGRKAAPFLGRTGLSTAGGADAGRERNAEVLEIDAKFAHLLGLTARQIVRYPKNLLANGLLAKSGYRLMWHYILTSLWRIRYLLNL